MYPLMLINNQKVHDTATSSHAGDDSFSDVARETILEFGRGGGNYLKC